MRGTIPLLPNRMKLGEYDTRRYGLKGMVDQQVVESCTEGFGKREGVVDPTHQHLRKTAQPDHRSDRIGMNVTLRKATEVSKGLPVSMLAQELKVDRLHEWDVVRKDHDRRLSKRRANIIRSILSQILGIGGGRYPQSLELSVQGLVVGHTQQPRGACLDSVCLRHRPYEIVFVNGIQVLIEFETIAERVF